jgi:hypothetical protein
MKKYNFITSFNETIYKNIGHHLIKSIDNQFEPTLNLTCYYHDCNIDSYKLIKKDSIAYKSINDIKEYNTFKEMHSIHDGTEGGQIAYNIKLDAKRNSHKVFALTKHAETLCNSAIIQKLRGWLIWIDADSYVSKRLTEADLDKMLPEDAHIAYRGLRNYEDGTQGIDSSIMAFNLNHQATYDLLMDLKKAYVAGEVFQYREWHDAFITERLMNIYLTHGLKTVTLEGITDTILHFNGNTNPSTLPLRDKEGNRLFDLSKEETSPDIMPNRYKQLAEVIRHYKPKNFLEVGTWNGGRAIEMALTAFEYTDKVEYYGYDLFEDGTTETDLEEFNVKAHNTMAAVDKRLTEFKDKMKEKKKTFTFVLTKGNSRETLKQENLFKFLPTIDFALIGGGNSIPTAKSDYDSLKHIPIVMMDHYFLADKDKNDVEEKFKGINEVFKSIDKEIKKYVLPSGDRVRGGGHTHLNLILHNKDLQKPPKELLNVPIVVNPRDCVPKDYIRNNIKANMKLIDKDKWLAKYPMNNKGAIVVSGGPYTDYKKLQDCIKNNPNKKIIAVKHSYPKLLEHGIKPWACIVLDPRPITGTSTHGVVRKELFKTIDSTTKFFVASMTDPSVTNYLIEKKADIWGWHAFTESLRDPEEQKKGIVNNQVTLNEELGIPKGSTLITGGTCAAMRAIGIMHTMGFRQFDLFGYDSCMNEPTDDMKKETTGADDEEPRPKYFKVAVKDKNFWTTGELLAMAQDCEKIFNENVLEMCINFHGKDTLISELWNLSQEQKAKQPSFERTFNE